MTGAAPTVLAVLSVAMLCAAGRPLASQNAPRVIADDAGWCWFEDERAIVYRDRLFAGTVANGAQSPSRAGDVEVTSVDLRSGDITRFTLHKNLEADDHNSPALLARPDGRILAMYAKHGSENRIYYRISTRAGDAAEWGETRTFVPSERSRVTYSNLYRLSAETSGRGRIYDFFRGLDDSFKPSWIYSDDDGETWITGGILIDFPARVKHRPYVKYASNGRDAIHFLFTEGHPNAFDNSLYHAYYQDGRMRQSDGTVIRPLSDGHIRPEQATRIFAGDPQNVAWCHDIELDARGYPRVVYSVQKDSAGLPRGQGGHDLRYRFARWDGLRWQDHDIAFAGSRLYAGEDDYAGGVSLHPDEPDVVYISTNVDPTSGKRVGAGFYEIYRGHTRDGGRSFTWSAVTRDSRADNLRPIVPRWRRGRTALLWLRGKYTAYTRYDLQMMLQVSP